MDSKEYFKKFSEKVPVEWKTKIKEIFDALGTPPAQPTPIVAPTPVHLQESKLKDGTVIKYDTPTLGVGSAVTIVSVDGEKPATEGEWVLEDGTMLKTSPDGKVIEITPVAVVPDLAPQMAQMKQEFENKLVLFADIKAFKALEDKHEETKKELAAVKDQFTKFVGAFSAILEIPSADPIDEPKNKFAENLNKKAKTLTEFKTK